MMNKKGRLKETKEKAGANGRVTRSTTRKEKRRKIRSSSSSSNSSSSSLSGSKSSVNTKRPRGAKSTSVDDEDSGLGVPYYSRSFPFRVWYNRLDQSIFKPIKFEDRDFARKRARIQTSSRPTPL